MKTMNHKNGSLKEYYSVANKKWILIWKAGNYFMSWLKGYSLNVVNS